MSSSTSCDDDSSSKKPRNDDDDASASDEAVGNPSKDKNLTSHGGLSATIEEYTDSPLKRSLRSSSSTSVNDSSDGVARGNGGGGGGGQEAEADESPKGPVSFNLDEKKPAPHWGAKRKSKAAPKAAQKDIGDDDGDDGGVEQPSTIGKIDLDRYSDDKRTPQEVFGYVRPYSKLQEISFGPVTLTEFKGIDVDGAPIIDALPTIGLVSVMTGKQIVKDLKLPLVAVITSEAEVFREACVIQEEQPSYPCRIYGDRSVVIFLCESKLPLLTVTSVVDCMFDFATRHQCPHIYTLEGMPISDEIELPDGKKVELGVEMLENSGYLDEDGPELQFMVDDTKLTKLVIKEKEKQGEARPSTPSKPLRSSLKPTKRARSKSQKKKEKEEDDIRDIAQEMFGKKIHYVTTDGDMARRLRGMGHIPVVDGVIPGVTGGILAKAPLTQQEVTAILAPTPAVFPNITAAVGVIELLESLLPHLELATSRERIRKAGLLLENTISNILSGLTKKAAQSKNMQNYMYT